MKDENESMLKAYGKVGFISSFAVFALHSGKVMVRMDDGKKPKARFLITTPFALADIAKKAKQVVAEQRKQDRKDAKQALTILVKRPKEIT